MAGMKHRYRTMLEVTVTAACSWPGGRAVSIQELETWGAPGAGGTGLKCFPEWYFNDWSWAAGYQDEPPLVPFVVEMSRSRQYSSCWIPVFILESKLSNIDLNPTWSSLLMRSAELGCKVQYPQFTALESSVFTISTFSSLPQSKTETFALQVKNKTHGGVLLRFSLDPCKICCEKLWYPV